MTADRALRAAAIALVVVLGVLGLALPGSIAVGGSAWLAFACFALSGWGWLVVRAARLDDVDFGLRAVWGIAAYLAIVGVLVMIGVCTRPIVLGLVGVGVAAFGWREWVTPEPLWQAAREGVRLLRARPIAGYCAIVIGAALVLHVFGAVVHLDRNPWDDDVAYTPLLQRLLQAGNLIEPFSFRRLASYGGQTALQALLGARGNLASVHAFDRGLCLALVALLAVGHTRTRRVPAFWLAVVALVLVLVPEIAINTASYWSGAALFYALYRTVALAESPRAFAVAALVGAATCTLRMNYLAVVVPFLALAFACRARRGDWRGELRAWRLAFGVGAAAIVPWCIASYISSRTFLYPLVQGTWNHGLALHPSGWSWVDQLSFVIVTCITAEPIVVLPIVLLLVAFARDDRPARPLSAFFAASALGFFLLAYTFTSADTYSIWRYAFGFALPLVIAFAIEAGDEEGPVQVHPLARWTLLAALLVQLAFARTGVVKRFTEVFDDLREASRAVPERVVEERRYRELQDAIPRGARVAVMVDDAVYLDFARNDLVNLDTPGFASVAPQMPSFLGPEALRAYFLHVGVRYIAFVRGDRSRYFFRRNFWVWRVFNDAEVFQAMSAYVIDTIDSLEQLATTSTVLYDHDGLVAIDLGTGADPAPVVDPGPESSEPERRDAFMRELAASEHYEPEWRLTSHRDLIFVDGMTGIMYPDSDADPRWFEVAPHDAAPVRGMPVRWMHRRSLLRVRGDRAMHLVLRGRVNLNAVYTAPRLTVSLDGELLASVRPDAHGAFVVDVVVPAAQLVGWCDLYAVFDSIGTPERDVHDLKIARLEEVEWEPR